MATSAIYIYNNICYCNTSTNKFQHQCKTIEKVLRATKYQTMISIEQTIVG